MSAAAEGVTVVLAGTLFAVAGIYSIMTNDQPTIWTLRATAFVAFILVTLAATCPWFGGSKVLSVIDGAVGILWVHFYQRDIERYKEQHQ